MADCASTGGEVVMKVNGLVLAGLVSMAFCEGAGAVEFMGVDIGGRFQLPECAAAPGDSRSYAFAWKEQVKPCWRGLMYRGDPLPEGKRVRIEVLPPRSVVGTGDMVAIVFDGSFGGIHLGTSGIDSQDALFSLLVEKFGKPQKTATERMSNAMGGTFDVRTATWRTDDAVVSFDGALSTHKSGLITVYTTEGAAAQAQFEREKAAAAPRF